MTIITSIEDLRVLAKKRVPRMFYDYADAGSWTESTYRANVDDFAKIKFRQRVAVNLENRTLASTMVGQPVAMPVALAPTGLTGMQHADGEILAAKAAEKFGVPFTLSTMSICSIEDIAVAITRTAAAQLEAGRGIGARHHAPGRYPTAGPHTLVDRGAVQHALVGRFHAPDQIRLTLPGVQSFAVVMHCAPPQSCRINIYGAHALLDVFDCLPVRCKTFRRIALLDLDSPCYNIVFRGCSSAG